MALFSTPGTVREKIKSSKMSRVVCMHCQSFFCYFKGFNRILFSKLRLTEEKKYEQDTLIYKLNPRYFSLLGI